MSSMELEIADRKNMSSWKDSVGIVASIGCAIHCAAMPFVIAYLPALGLSFLADEAFHKWMALICFLIALAAFLPGLRKHGSWVPVGVGSTGLALITFAAFGLAGECCPSCEAAANAIVSTPVAASANDNGSVEAAFGHVEECCSSCEATATVSSKGNTEAAFGQVEECCASCESVNAGTKAASIVSTDFGPCSDLCETECDHCDHCLNEPSNEQFETVSMAVGSTSEEKGLLSKLAPWITPFGGLLLVAAHLMNRRFGSLCDCC